MQKKKTPYLGQASLELEEHLFMDMCMSSLIGHVGKCHVKSSCDTDVNCLWAVAGREVLHTKYLLCETFPTYTSTSKRAVLKSSFHIEKTTWKKNCFICSFNPPMQDIILSNGYARMMNIDLVAALKQKYSSDSSKAGIDYILNQNPSLRILSQCSFLCM